MFLPKQIFDPKIINVQIEFRSNKMCNKILGSDKNFNGKINTGLNKFVFLKMLNPKKIFFPRTAFGVKELFDSKKVWIHWASVLVQYEFWVLKYG